MPAPEGMYTDHSSGDSLDNTRENLRIVDPSQNAMNAQTRKDNKSGVKGVCWDEASKSWLVQLHMYGKRVFKKRYKTKEQAIFAILIARKKYHGEYARAA
jgi:hypothetical protein